MINCFAMFSSLFSLYPSPNQNMLALDISDIPCHKSIPASQLSRKSASRLKTFWLPLLCFFLIFSPVGCVRQNNASSAEVKFYSSGDLSLPHHADAPRNIYIEARNEQGEPFKISSTLQAAFAAQNFKIVDSPSEAGYILHINILQEGPVNQALFEKLVKAGYGSKAAFSGKGAEGLLVDALLVQRRVPSAKHPDRAKLKNISTRNALESAQMRLGTIIPREVADRTSAHDALSINLARALRNALAEENMAAAK